MVGNIDEKRRGKPEGIQVPGGDIEIPVFCSNYKYKVKCIVPQSQFLQWWHCNGQWQVFSVSELHVHKGFKFSWNLCWKRCLFTWLKPKQKQVRNFNPSGTKMLKILLYNRRMKDNGSGSRWSYSYRDTVKKCRLEELCSTIVTWSLFISSIKILLTLWN